MVEQDEGERVPETTEEAHRPRIRSGRELAETEIELTADWVAPLTGHLFEGTEGLTPRRPSSRAERVSPVDLPAEPVDHVRPLLWASGVIALATGYLLVANAVSLDGWVAEQPPSPTMETVTEASDAWRGGTEATGLATPRDALHRAWRRAEAVRFPGQPAPDPS